MSEQNHPWCSSPSRDEAIRAAEDDAAQWRRLEVGEVVQEGDEYLVGGWQSVRKSFVGRPMDRGYVPHRRRRVPLPDHRDLPAAVAELRERVAKIEDAMVSGSTWFPKSDQPAPPPPSAPPQITEGDTLTTVRDGGGRPMPKGPPPGLKAKAETTAADGLRTERVTLEVTHGSSTPASQWEWKYHIRPRNLFESVRVVEDATIGSGDVFRDVGCGSTGDEIDRLTAERNAAREKCERLKARVAELEAAAAPAANAGGEQQPPRGWLTPEERKVLTEVADEAEKSPSKERWAHVASCVRGLLARETPPRVKVPTAESSFSWIVAILEAGGEVE